MNGYELTKDDIYALRTADRITFHKTEDYPAIRCLKQVKQHTIWDEKEKTHAIECDAVLTAGQRDWKPSRGYEMIHASSFCRQWQTIAGFLRKGDQIEIVFHTDYHTNGNLDEVGYHADALLLNVCRNGKAKPRYYQFHVSTRIGPHNTARMVQ